MKKTERIGRLVRIALFAAIIAVLSQIAVPMPSGVPVTLQTFAVALCAFFLGWKDGTAAVLVYLALGAVGAPVFASFRGGFAVLFGPTGGFLVGFLLMALLTGLASRRKWYAAVPCGVAGLLLCHLTGVVWFLFVAHRTFAESLLAVSLPYLPKDLLSLAAAYGVVLALRRIPALRSV